MTPVAGSGGKYHRSELTQVTASGSDLNGVALPTTTTGTQYDDYGNARVITVGTGDGYAKTTTNSYVNDESNWLLGRLKSSTVQSIIPAAP